jgi:hypothetical protein
MDITKQIQLCLTTIYAILFYIFFNYAESDYTRLSERIITSAFMSLFAIIILIFVITLLMILSFYKYYDYEDFIMPRRRMRRR